MFVPCMSVDRMLAVAMNPLFNSNGTSKPRMKTFTQVKTETLKALERGNMKVTECDDCEKAK